MDLIQALGELGAAPDAIAEQDRRDLDEKGGYVAREHEQQLDQRQYLRHETFKRIARAARYILDVDLD